MNSRRVRIGRDGRFVDILEGLEALAPQPGETVRVEAPKSHEFFSSPAYYRILAYRWPAVRFTLSGTDGQPRRLAAALGASYAAPGSEADPAARGDLLAHNFTFWEYLWYEVRRKFSASAPRLPGHVGAKARAARWVAPFAVSAAALALLGAAGSYAFVPRTVVTLVPQQVTRVASANLSFSEGDAPFSAKAVPVRRASRKVSLARSFAVGGVDASASPRAVGDAEMANETGTGLLLRPGTRFLAPDGTVFRLPDWTNVPVGTSRIRLVADVSGPDGKPYGARANVATGTLFSVPGLGDLADRAWAKAAGAFAGATGEAVPLFTAADRDSFLGIAREKLLSAAREAAAADLSAANAADPVATWALLPAAGALELSAFTGSFSAAVGDHVPEVSMSAEAVATSLAFDRSAAEVYLRQSLFDRLLSGRESLAAMQPQTFRLAYEFSRTPAPFFLRATAEEDASVSYLLPDAVSGPSSLALRQEIAGKSESEAVSFLLRDPEIAAARVSSSPFWFSGVAPDPARVRIEVAR